MDRILSFLDRWVSRPVAILAAFGTILGMLAWALNRLSGVRIAFVPGPSEFTTFKPQISLLHIPAVQQIDIPITLLGITGILATSSILGFVALTYSARSQSRIADVFAILLPPAYTLASVALATPLAIQNAPNPPTGTAAFALCIGALCTGIVSFTAWTKFSSKERFQRVNGRKMNFIEWFYHLFWVRFVGFSLAVEYTLLPPILMLVVKPAS